MSYSEQALPLPHGELTTAAECEYTGEHHRDRWGGKVNQHQGAP